MIYENGVMMSYFKVNLLSSLNFHLVKNKQMHKYFMKMKFTRNEKKKPERTKNNSTAQKT